MNTDDSTLSSQQALASTLKELVEVLSLFADLLQQEQQALSQFQPDAIDILTQLTQQKADTATKIEALYQTLTQALISASLIHASGSINFLQLSHDSRLPKDLKQTFHQVHQLITNNHQANLRNGMLIQSLTTLNQQALLTLKGQNESFNGYNAKGKKQQTSTPNTPLGKA